MKHESQVPQYLTINKTVNADTTHPHFIDASTGNPAFPIPKRILDASIAASEHEDSRAYNLSTMHGHDADDALFREQIANYLKRHKLLAKDISLALPDAPSNSAKQLDVILGNGLTEIYNAIIQSIIQSPGDVVIMPCPTYGLFVAQVEREGTDARVAYVQLDTNYKVTVQALADVCQATTTTLANTYKLQLLMATGYPILLAEKSSVDTSELKRLVEMINIELDQVIATPQAANYDRMDALHAELMAEIDRTIKLIPSLNLEEIDGRDLIKNCFQFRLCPRLRAFLHMNPHNPYGTVYTQTEIDAFATVIAPYTDMCVIDDFAHAEVRMGNVGLFHSALHDRTFSLYGFSKNFGLAAYRVGLCVAPQELLVTVCEYISQNSVTTNYAGKMLVKQIMMETDNRVIQAHFKKCDTFYNKQLAYAVSQFPLLQDTPPETNTQPQVKMANYPESGFFIMLDFSNFVGMYYLEKQLTSSSDFQWLLQTVCGVDTISADQCFAPHLCQLRFSLSIEEKELKEACARINAVTDLLKDKPRKSLAESERTTAVNKRKIQGKKTQQTQRLRNLKRVELNSQNKVIKKEGPTTRLSRSMKVPSG